MLEKLDLQLFAEEEEGEEGKQDKQDKQEGHEEKNDKQEANSQKDEAPAGFKDHPRWQELIDQKNSYKQLASERKQKIEQLQEKIENLEGETEEIQQVKEEAKETVEKISQQAKDKAKISELKLEAKKAGINEQALDRLQNLIDLEKLELEDAEDKDFVDLGVTNADEVIEELKETDPYLFGNNDNQESSSGGEDFKEGDKLNAGNSSIRKAMGLD